MIEQAVFKLVGGETLAEDEAKEVMYDALAGRATPAQLAAFLTALRMRGETVDVIVGLAKAMRDSAVKIKPSVTGRLIDTCGTGGDNSHTFNASTAAAIIAAGAGVYVAKHGNRSVSSRSGSADVLEALGVNITADPDVVKRCIEQVGIGFLFAQVFHPAMRNVAQVRRELKFRTVFNILGPLTNPAGVNAQVVGVAERELLEKMTASLMKLGLEEGLVVHGYGIDEIQVTGPTEVIHFSGDDVTELTVNPEMMGARRHDVGELRVDSLPTATHHMFGLLYYPEKAKAAIRDFALCNAAASLIIGGKAEEFSEGFELARMALYSGKAYEKLRGLVKSSGGDISKLEELERRFG